MFGLSLLGHLSPPTPGMARMPSAAYCSARLGWLTLTAPTPISLSSLGSAETSNPGAMVQRRLRLPYVVR